MPSYGEYLKIDELLGLQQPLSEGPEHDETLFIVIHQVYELWFKEILHELDYLEGLLSRNDGVRARHTLKRILTILKVMVAQLDIGSSPAADSSRTSSASSSLPWAGRTRRRWSAIRREARAAAGWSAGWGPARCGTRSSAILWPMESRYQKPTSSATSPGG
jgi:hypothetical protein